MWNCWRYLSHTQPCYNRKQSLSNNLYLFRIYHGEVKKIEDIKFYSIHLPANDFKAEVQMMIIVT